MKHTLPPERLEALISRCDSMMKSGEKHPLFEKVVGSCYEQSFAFYFKGECAVPACHYPSSFFITWAFTEGQKNLQDT